MKYKNYLQDVENINIYPLVSLLIFTAVFVCVIIYAFGTDKKKLQDKANIPLN